MDSIRNQNISQTMEDEISHHNQNPGQLSQLIENIPMQIESIVHDVSSTKNTVELMAAKLDDLIGKLERRDFLDNPSHWQNDAVERNNHSSDFGLFP